MKRLSAILAASLLAAPAVGCIDEEDPYDGETVKSDDGKADASALGVFLDAEFNGKLLVDSSWNDLDTIDASVRSCWGGSRSAKESRASRPSASSTNSSADSTRDPALR